MPESYFNPGAGLNAWPSYKPVEEQRGMGVLRKPSPAYFGLGGNLSLSKPASRNVNQPTLTRLARRRGGHF